MSIANKGHAAREQIDHEVDMLFEHGVNTFGLSESGATDPRFMSLMLGHIRQDVVLMAKLQMAQIEQLRNLGSISWALWILVALEIARFFF